jgi:hypothetical protein
MGAQMARKVDVARLKSRSIKALHEVIAQFDAAAAKLGTSEYLLVRWMAQMTAVLPRGPVGASHLDVHRS